MAALEVVVARTERVCPLECDDDKVERDGKCVPRNVTPRKPSVATTRPAAYPLNGAKQEPRSVAADKSSTGRRCAPDCWNARYRNKPRCADC